MQLYFIYVMNFRHRFKGPKHHWKCYVTSNLHFILRLDTVGNSEGLVSVCLYLWTGLPAITLRKVPAYRTLLYSIYPACRGSQVCSQVSMQTHAHMCTKTCTRVHTQRHSKRAKHVYSLQKIGWKVTQCICNA